jgi:NAD-dependent SIR2 family protein deacetylase
MSATIIRQKTIYCFECGNTIAPDEVREVEREVEGLPLMVPLCGVCRSEVDDIELDLSEIADFLIDEAGGDTVPPPPWMFYSDGALKPYTKADSHLDMVRKAQASWSFDDGEAA